MWIAVVTVIAILASITLCGVLRSRHRREMAALRTPPDKPTADGTTR